MLAAPGQDQLPPDDATDALPTPDSQGNQIDQEIALAQVDGRVKLSAIKRIGDAVSASPAEATSVIRQWMAS